MWSVCSSLQLVLVPPWKHQIKLLNHPSNSFRFINFPPFLHILSSFSHDNDSASSTPDKNQLGFDPSEEIFGLDVDMPPRDVKSDGLEPRSWFGSNGQYVKELPCPSCRGRGYTPCTECGIERSRQDCSLCNGKGIVTCQHCLGECVIWEESIDENPWEKARSISPLKVKEDDEVDNLELDLNARKKSKRVYRSTPPEVGLKISRSLKSLNAKTGIFSKRMKIIHRDPALHAQRVAAIKKAKGTPAARKHTSDTLKKFFSDPENRRKRSMSMKGVKFFCKNCGLEGHRSNYCPKREQNIDRRFKCGLCGEKGHNRRTCGKPSTLMVKRRILGQYHCRACGQVGHNSRTCSMKSKLQSVSDAHDSIDSRENSKGEYRSSFKGSKDKYRGSLKESKDKFWDYLRDLKGHVHQRHHCSICKKVGHNRRTCSLKTELQSHNTVPENRVSLEDAEVRDGGSHVVLKGENGGFFEDTKGNHESSVEDSKGKYKSSFKDSKGSSTASLEDLNVILASENRGFSENIKDKYSSSFEHIKGKYRDSSKDLKGEYRVYHKKSNGVRSGCFGSSELHNKGSLEESKGIHKGSLEDSNLDSHKHHHHHCGLCGKAGHNRRTCHLKTEQLSGSEAQNKVGSLNDSKEFAETRYHHCRVCGRRGHNRRTCFENSPKEVDVNTSISERARSYRCRICGVIGHNRRTCVNKKG